MAAGAGISRGSSRGPPLPNHSNVGVTPDTFLEQAFTVSAPDVVTTIHARRIPRASWYWKSAGEVAGGAGMSMMGGQVVTVHAVFDAGQYRAAVLCARQAGGLEQWLREHGYMVPEGAAAALQPYVTQAWSFVALKPRVDLRDARTDSFDLEPLALSFTTDRLVYAVALTRLSSWPRLSVLLAVVHRQPVRCVNLPTVAPKETVALPRGSLYRTYRRKVAEVQPGGALLREAVIACGAEIVERDGCRRHVLTKWLAGPTEHSARDEEEREERRELARWVMAGRKALAVLRAAGCRSPAGPLLRAGPI